MKNLKYIVLLGSLLLFNIKSFAQFPLNFGDGVITHSPISYTTSGTNHPIIRVIHTANTASAPFGSNWNVPLKPANDFYDNWTANYLGPVFGITIDQNTKPNVYVSSTQIYTNTNLNKRKVWRLDGTTGAHSLVYDFNNPSGTGINESEKSLGNVKYFKINTTENIYVSDWQTGEIRRLTGNSASSILWSNQQGFNQKFGKQNDDPTEMPYGIAVRKISASKIKLYYSKISTNSNSDSIGGYGNNEIYSIDINPSNGDFIVATETIASIPNINLTPTSWGGYGTPAPSYLCTILPVISDIAFTNDSKKMLIGQQSWGGFGILTAHNSKVFEFENLPFMSGIWANSSNLFPPGQNISQTFSCGINGNNNAVGGVSYSDNKLRQNAVNACDKSVYFSSDFIYIDTNYPSTYVYGVQGMNSTGGNISNSIWIDADDSLAYYDKTCLGDVEIYKNPQICNPCECGSWGSIGLNDNANWWVNSAAPQPAVTTLSFNQGASMGVLFPKYNCNGDCDATFSYSISGVPGANIILTGSSSLNLSQPVIRNLPCGSYTVNITPSCGNIKCPPIGITLIIVCPPPCSNCSGNATVSINETPTVNNGQVFANFTINNSTPVAEVRVLVDEFRITSTNQNENCLLCKNPPKTWGSIQSATFGALSPAFSNLLSTDNREAVFSNGNLIAMPSILALKLALPQTTKLDCCNLKVEICLKITIRDVYCCEKEILKCFTFDLK